MSISPSCIFIRVHQLEQGSGIAVASLIMSEAVKASRFRRSSGAWGGVAPPWAGWRAIFWINVPLGVAALTRLMSARQETA
jgi:hypothetical protein